MQGSLYIPLRGSVQQIAYARGQLFINTRHPEGHSLGLARFPLEQWARGEVSDELRDRSSGLSSLESPAPLAWIGATSSGGLWWVSDQAEVGYESPDVEFEGHSLQGLTTIGGKKSPVSVDGALFCVTDERLLALAPNADSSEGSWTLWEVKSTGKKPRATQLWCGDLAESSSQGDEGDAQSAPEVRPTSAQQGPGVSGWGLSDGRVALWFDARRDKEWTPLFTQPHSDPVCALSYVHAEDKDYLITYSEDLKLAQTRLDDLEPMPRAAKGKGLHTTPPVALVPSPLGRFYSVGDDGVRAWFNAYSNLRPAGHEEVGERLGGRVAAATLAEYSSRDLEGVWANHAALAVAGPQQVVIYSLTNPSAAEEEERGEDLSSERGRLGEVVWGAEGASAWIKHRLSSDDETTRLSAIETLIQWNDDAALRALERVSARDAEATLRHKALDAIIASEHPSVIYALDRLLGASYPKVACAALDALRTPFGRESLYPMNQAIKLGEAGVTTHALTLLGDLGAAGHESARLVLKAQLNHAEPELAEVARAQLERCYPAPRGALVGLASSHDAVRTMAIHRLWEGAFTDDPIVSGRLQQLREDDSREVRRYALAASLLGHPALCDALRSADPLLHEELNKVQARTLEGEARANQLGAEAPSPASEVNFDDRARQLLFEISAGGQPDVAVHGPVALAQTGDLRALPALLSLSRAEEGEVRLRATRGLTSLAQSGERRARAQLQSLSHDELTEVRQVAYRGLSPLFDDALEYASFGLQASHSDVRLAALTALQDAPSYRGERSLTPRGVEVLSLALRRRDDLGLAQEARKVYLRDQVGGGVEQALALILRSLHSEVREVALADLIESLKGTLVTDEAISAVGAGGDGLSGESFLFTGTLERMKRADAQKLVKELGGSVASGVTSSLSFLVIGDKGKAGSKLTKANQLGVTVLSETQFWEMTERAKQPAGDEAQAADSAETDPSAEEAERAQRAALSEVFRLLFNDPQAELRLEAVRKVIGPREGEGALRGEQRFTALDVALQSKASDVRLAAVEAVAGSADATESRARLRSLVADAELSVARAALQAALKLAEDDLGALVEEGLSLEDDKMRTLVVQAAASAPQKMSWREDVLLRAIADGVSGIRDLAFSALRADEVVTVAAQLLDHDRSDVRDRAALTLARVGDERALSVALEVLQTPAPKPDDVIAAQEAAGGSFGLLDDLQWKRQVTLALSAQQRAFAAASASAGAAVSDSSDDDAEATSAASAASAVGVAYAEQSLSALVSVNDEIEGAVERAARRWRARISAGLRVVREGRFESAFDVVWGLVEGDDPEVAAEATQTLSSCVSAAQRDLIDARLNSDSPDRSLAWALVHLGDPRGLNAILSSGASAQERVEAGLSLGGASAERSLALSVARGGEAAQASLYAEVLRLIHFGGDCPLIAAGLSSEDEAWRRECARWIAAAHDLDALKSMWAAEMTERRPQADLEWEREMARFEADEVKTKPKGSRPHWVSDAQWSALAELAQHPERRARHFAARALFDLPSGSDSAKQWTLELDRQVALAQTCRARRDQAAQEANPVIALPKAPQLALSESEAQALAFGTYASLVSGSRDVESLKALSALFATDPIGARAILQMSLRDDGALQREALTLLERDAETLGLDDLRRADLLISTDQPTCVQRGAQLLARVDSARALGLILSDDGEAASSAAHALLELEPQRGVELLSASLRSPNPSLRDEGARRWVGMLRAWPKGDKSISEDDDKALKSTRLEVLDLKVLRAISAQMGRDQAVETLLSHLTSDDAETRVSSDAQLSIAERLHAERALTKSEMKAVVEPLKRLLASTEPELYRRALRALRDCGAKGAAEAILDRLTQDPTRSADPSETLSALSELRDAKVVSQLTELMGPAVRDPDQSRLDIDELERCLLEISGHDEPIDEDAVWEEMDEDARKSESDRKYQDATLATLIDRCAQLGRYDEIYHYLDLVDAAQTARSADVNESLFRLARLPIGQYELDRLRVRALDAIIWRVRHRALDPEPIVDLVEHRELQTRLRAAEALAYAKRSEGIRLLIGVARDRHEDYDLRERSVNALGASGDLRAVQLLLQLFDDVEDNLRAEALEALSVMRDSEVADEILARLIQGLSSDVFVEVSIRGTLSFDHEDLWSAVRGHLSRARRSSWVNQRLAESLKHDPSAEVVALFERVIAESDLYDRDTRVQAYRSWCERLRREAGVSVDELAVTLEPATQLFKTDLTSQSVWSDAVEVIVEHGAPALWVDLAFAAQKMSAKHQGEVSKLEAKLRGVEPAPLDLLLPRLSLAISDAPGLARMTLAILGARASDLSEDHRAQLLSATSDVRSTWLTRDEERRAGARDPEFKVVTELWRQLLWLWGRAEGGADALWEALETPELVIDLYREALFSLEARQEASDAAVKITERLIEAPAAKIPELSPIVTRLAARVGLGALALGDDRAESLGGLSLGDWDVLRELEASESVDALLDATRRGDAMALSALIGKQSTASVTTLLGEVSSGALASLSEAARLELVRSCATLGDAEVEEALVSLAKATSDEELAREAWRARRRSARRRAQHQDASRAQ